MGGGLGRIQLAQEKDKVTVVESVLRYNFIYLFIYLFKSAKNEMGGACGTYGAGESGVQGSGGET